jgi:hypothetical protein
MINLADVFQELGFHLEASLKLHCSCVFLRSLFVELKADIELLEKTNLQLASNQESKLFQNCIKENFGLRLEDFYEYGSKTRKDKGAFGVLYIIKHNR